MNRRRAMCNLMGTLLLSAGVPMITAGDEFARTQQGNNNAYCQDSPLTWMSWQHGPWQTDLYTHVRRLLRLRQENPALRPTRFGRLDEHTPSASIMEWFDEHGQTMSAGQWGDPVHRTLQYVATSTPEFEEPNRILLVIHGREQPTQVTLPQLETPVEYASLWRSDVERPDDTRAVFRAGQVVPMPGTSMHLFRVDAMEANGGGIGGDFFTH